MPPTAENARQPPEVQLNRAELNVDLDYSDILEEKRSDAIEVCAVNGQTISSHRASWLTYLLCLSQHQEVHKINAHDSERAWKLRTKLQQHFWDPVLVPSMRLRGFHSHDVRSLRTRQVRFHRASHRYGLVT